MSTAYSRARRLRLQNIRDAGFAAFHKGEPWNKNPFNPGDEGRAEWKAGWVAAEAAENARSDAELEEAREQDAFNERLIKALDNPEVMKAFKRLLEFR